jgi:hypothetical protein
MIVVFLMSIRGAFWGFPRADPCGGDGLFPQVALAGLEGPVGAPSPGPPAAALAPPSGSAAVSLPADGVVQPFGEGAGLAVLNLHGAGMSGIAPAAGGARGLPATPTGDQASPAEPSTEPM